VTEEVTIDHCGAKLATFDDVIVEFAWYLESWLLSVNDGHSPPVEPEPTVKDDAPELTPWVESPV
jgi:hypothetical protein